MFDFKKTNAIAVLFDQRPVFVKNYKSCLRNNREDVLYGINTGHQVELGNEKPGQIRCEKWIKKYNEFLEKFLTSEELNDLKNMKIEAGINYLDFWTKDRMKEIRQRLWDNETKDLYK